MYISPHKVSDAYRVYKPPVDTGHRWSRNVPSVETEVQQTVPPSTPNHSRLDESAHDSDFVNLTL